jgi:hydroxypyruvate isomerase
MPTDPPRLAANLSTMFGEHPVAGRVAAAQAAGFAHVEMQFPYGHVPSLSAALAATGVAMVLVNAPPGDWAAGERGLAALPGRRDDFRRSVAEALAAAEALGAGLVHLMAGITDDPAADETYAANLAWAAAQDRSRRFTIEPLNPVDMPGYHLASFDHAARVLDAVGAPNLGLQFDAYHARRIAGDVAGDVAGVWARHGYRASHVQIADAPGRHEPGTGAIDLTGFLARLAADGYPGAVGAEYVPAGETRAGLGWAWDWRALGLVAGFGEGVAPPPGR